MAAAALALWVASALAGCGQKPAKVMGEERETFAVRCEKLCTSTGFDGAKVKELEIVGETVTRECYCTQRGELTPKPYLVETGPR